MENCCHYNISWPKKEYFWGEVRELFENCSHSSGRLFPFAAAAAALVFVAAAAFFALRAPARSLRGTEGRCAWLSALGWQADPASEELREITLPARFDALLEDYNALQLAQGWDLRAAAGKSCLCCSYDLVGYPDWDGRVIATLYLFRGRVIGGDLHTAAADGFMRPLRQRSINRSCNPVQKQSGRFYDYNENHPLR